VAEREAGAVVGPRNARDARAHLVLGHRLLLGRPQAEVGHRRRGKRGGHGVVLEALDRVVVRVLEDALRLGRPDDDGLIGAARGEALAVARVGDAVERILVPFERLLQLTRRRIVDEHAVAAGNDYLRAVGTERNVLHLRPHAFLLRHLVRPRDHRPNHC